jgi:predicted nucleic acid-binding protein
VLLVLDANVLVSELLRVRGRDLIQNPQLRLHVSERAWDEARYELPRRAGRIVTQGRMTREIADEAVNAAFALAGEEVAVVLDEAYTDFEERAAYRIPRDPNDVPTVALALALGGDEGRCGIWTNDGDFLGCGIPTWTSDTLLAHLRYTGRT